MQGNQKFKILPELGTIATRVELLILNYIPGPDNDLSMNRFLEKQSHHFDGFPSSVLNTFSQMRFPHSCLTCCKYWRRNSASCPDAGLRYTEFKTNPGSPGISNLLIASVYISCIPWFLFVHLASFLRHSLMYKVM